MNRKQEIDSSMMTAPRDRILILERRGVPAKFIGKWCPVTGWWLNERGEKMTNVYSWKSIPKDIKIENIRTWLAKY